MYGGKRTGLCFLAKYLNIGRENILRELERLSGGKDVALICYEAPGDFCHRHLLVEYLNNNHNTNIRELKLNLKNCKKIKFFVYI